MHPAVEALIDAFAKKMVAEQLKSLSTMPHSEPEPLASRIPFVELALDAAEVGALLRQERRYVLKKIAPLPGFPAPCSLPGKQKR